MTDGPGRVTVPLAFWGVVQGQVAQRASTADLWAAIEARATELGVPLPAGMFQAVNELRSAGVQLRESSARLSGAPGENAITSDYIASLPYGPSRAPAAPRTFDVRVNYTSVKAGEPNEGYIRLLYDSASLPGTVGELRAEAFDVASALVESYGESFVNMGDLEIGEL